MKILLVCPNWVGDAVMATPTIRSLRNRFPDATIHALAKRTVVETLAGNPWIDFYLVREDFERRRGFSLPAVAARLRREAYDVAVLFPGSLGSALEAWLGGAKRRVGYARELRGVLLTDALSPEWSPRGYVPTPIVDYYLKLAGRLGGDVGCRRMELFVAPADAEQARDLLRRRQVRPFDPVVALNPGGAYGPAKRWPEEYFAELARRLVDGLSAKVFVLCGPAERDAARRIAAASERGRAVHSLADEGASIGLSKALVAESDLLVTTDSGPRHFAAAFGTPAVSLFGPTHIEWTQTYFSDEIQLQRKLPCGPCQKRTCPQGHHRCMKELTVAEVYAAAVQALRRSQPTELAG